MKKHSTRLSRSSCSVAVVRLSVERTMQERSQTDCTRTSGIEDVQAYETPVDRTDEESHSVGKLSCFCLYTAEAEYAAVPARFERAHAGVKVLCLASLAKGLDHRRVSSLYLPPPAAAEYYNSRFIWEKDTSHGCKAMCGFSRAVSSPLRHFSKAENCSVPNLFMFGGQVTECVSFTLVQNSLYSAGKRVLKSLPDVRTRICPSEHPEREFRQNFLIVSVETGQSRFQSC